MQRINPIDKKRRNGEFVANLDRKNPTLKTQKRSHTHKKKTNKQSIGI